MIIRNLLAYVSPTSLSNLASISSTISESDRSQILCLSLLRSAKCIEAITKFVLIGILFVSCGKEVNIPVGSEKLFRWSCDAENVQDDGKLLAKELPNILFSGGEQRVMTEAYSGIYSVQADSLNPFVMSITIGDAVPGNVYRLSIQIKAQQANAMLVASNDDFWEAAYQLENKDEDGWEKLDLLLTIPANSSSGDFKIYGWNNGKTPVYFDDLVVERMNATLPSDFDMSIMYMYLSESDQEKLERLAVEALDKGLLVNSDESWVKALVFYEDQMMDAKIRLKGDWTDHLKGVKWSFRVKLSSDDAWNGMRTFSLQNPAARSFVEGYVAHQIFEKEDVLTPRYDFVPLMLNNKSLGLYAYEEHYDKQLVENNQRREGPIVRMAEGHLWEAMNHKQTGDYPIQSGAVIEPFKNNRILSDSNLKAQFLVAQKLLFDYQQLKSEVHEIFDVDCFARYCALTDLLSFGHGMNWHNQRFYYNPIISKLEPIAVDGYGYYQQSTSASKELVGLFNEKTIFDRWTEHIMVRRMMGDSEFMSVYIGYLRKYSEPKYLGSVLEDLSGRISLYEKHIQNENPTYHFNPEKFLNQAAYIRENLALLNPFMYANLRRDSLKIIEYNSADYQSTLPKFFVNPYRNDHGEVAIQNYYADSIELIGIVRPGRFPRSFNKNYSISGFKWGQPGQAYIPVNTQAGDLLAFKVVGHDEIHNRALIPWPHPSSYRVSRLATHIPENFFIEEDSLIILAEGEYIVSTSIVIPSGYRLVVEKGVSIDFKNHSTLLTYSPVSLEGTADYPIEMRTSDGTGYGLNIIQAKGKSSISYLNYVGMDAFRCGRWTLSGALNIYESDVEIDHLYIRDNRCEDALNIIRSDFLVTNSTFENIYSDAFDSDFSTGTLRDSQFKNVANDAVDFSGSTVDIIDCQMETIGDKGVSGGEGSTLTVSNCQISKAKIGIASKDKSLVSLTDITLESCEYGLVVFKKKPEYGPATIVAEGLSWEDVDRVLLIENRSSITLDGKLIEGKKKNVAKLFY